MLSNGANPNARDTFYKATPMTWAIQNGHIAVAVELAVHGSEEAASVLASVAESGETELLARLIKTGKFDSGSFTRALMSAKADDAKTIAMLKAAGAKPVTAVPIKLLEEYAGEYELQPGFVIEVRRDNDKLVAQLTGQPEFPIYAETDTKFFWTVVEATLTFERNDEGNVHRAVLHQMGRTMPAPRMGSEPTEAIDPAAVAKYVGLYESEDGDVFRVAIENGQLVIGRDGSTLSPVRSTGENTFQSSGVVKVGITFTLDGDRVTGYIADTGTEKLSRKRVLEPAPVEVRTAKSYQRTEPTNWPSFRGATASGVGDGQGAPTKWNSESGEGIKWKTAVPGLGHSSPVVWADRLFVTTAVSTQESEFRAGPYGDVKSADDNTEHEWKLYCLDAKTGAVNWERTVHKGLPRTARHTKASQASCTPAVDATHVVVNFGSEGLYSYDHDGNLLWKKDLGELEAGWFYDPTYQWGYSSSPVIHDNLIIVQADLSSGASIAAYDVNSGSEVWREQRDELPSWGTPTIVESPRRVSILGRGRKHHSGAILRDTIATRLSPHSCRFRLRWSPCICTHGTSWSSRWRDG